MEKTAGGLFLPGDASDRKKGSTGTVIAVGPGYLMPETGKLAPMNVKVGDEVMIPEYGGMKIEFEDKTGFTEGEDRFLYREGDILGTFR